MSNEHILAFLSSELAVINDGVSQDPYVSAWNDYGFTARTDHIDDVLQNNMAYAMRVIWRPDAEKEAVPGNPHRQILPYCVLSRIVNGEKQYAVYQRVKGTAESRLLGRHSIGFGGHITPEDFIVYDGVIDYNGTVINGAARELREEAGVDICDGGNTTTTRLGYIHSVASEVDSLHFAAVLEITLSERVEVHTREEAMVFKGFATAEQLKAMALEFEFENWSKFIIEAL